LAPALREAGLRVIGTSQREQPLPGFDRVHAARLGDSLRPLLDSEPVYAVVHAALETGRNAYEVNVAGTVRWLEEAQSAGARAQVLLSSLSADAQALSDYGRAKYELERRFIAAGQIVFRLGVVVGEGGMFGRMIRSARRSPVVPLLDGGRQPVYLLGMDCLCLVVRDAILSDGDALRGRVWNLHQPAPFTLQEVMGAIARDYGLHRLFLPVPARPVLALLRVVEKLPFPRLPVTSTHVLGLIQAARQAPVSDSARFGCAEATLDALISFHPH
jgi:nucleoside-diphosphate-sugar epimerase